MTSRDFSSLLKAFADRGLAILRDDSSSDSIAVLVAPAQDMQANVVNEILHLTGGHLFVALSKERAEGFMLPPMVPKRKLTDTEHPSSATSHEHSNQNRDQFPSACVSVEAREGVTTGISAFDRAHTISILGELEPNPRKLVKPGHIFPITVRPGGVLVKNAIPEGALDLIVVSGKTPAAMYVDLLNSSGSYASVQEQDLLAKQRDLPVFLLSEIVRYRLETEKLVRRVASAKLPTKLAGELTAHLYRSAIHDGEHLALVKGNVGETSPTLVRVQTESTFSDVFASTSNQSRARLHEALRVIGERGSGVLLYLRRPYQGGMVDELRAIENKRPLPTSAVMREYGLGAQILRDLGVTQIELLTGSEKNLVGLKPFGIEIVSQQLLKRGILSNGLSQESLNISVSQSSEEIHG